uniref:Uracil-DNA glycosylase n=1 Tax=Desulfovibrio sp. U5L TaxID=596152 RepID=I2PX92_9BACT
MGLHDSLLEVPERLRVWQQAGVRYLYFDPARPTAAAGPDAPGAEAVAQTEESRPEAASAVVSTGNAASPVPGVADASFREVEAPGVAAAPDLPPGETAPPGPSGPDVPILASIPDDPADWPGPWPALFAKAPAAPRLVITYSALGQDLTGRADPRRSNLWRMLINELGLAGQNAVAFWPVSLPGSDDPGRDRALFVAGLKRLSPRMVAVFGDAAARLVRPFAAELPDIALAFFSDPRPLLRGDTEAWDHVLTVLDPVRNA